MKTTIDWAARYQEFREMNVAVWKAHERQEQDRMRTTKANANRRARDDARRDCGLTRGRDSMGRRIWE